MHTLIDAGSMTELHRGGWRLRQARKRMVDTALRHGATSLRCWRCQNAIDLTLSGLHPDGLTVGHILPVSMGGEDSFDNLGPEHRRCNLAAGARVAPPAATVVGPIDMCPWGEDHRPGCPMYSEDAMRQAYG